jgi:O-antigen/teichoic acid export membrane protein
MQAVILFAPEIIRVVAGSAYSQAVDILRLVIIGLFASYLFYFFHLSITIAEKLVLLLATYLIALVISLISGFILIPLFGGMGAGMAYAITFIIQSLSLYFLAQRQQHYNYPVKRIYGSIFASFLLIIPLSLVYVNLAIRSIIFVFLLFISIYVFIDELRKPSMFLQRFELNMDKID